VLRIVRDTKQPRLVEQVDDCRCQICRDRLGTSGGLYAEGAHIRPLGKPQNGPDILADHLCICPSHDAYIDRASLTLGDSVAIGGAGGDAPTAGRASESTALTACKYPS